MACLVLAAAALLSAAPAAAGQGCGILFSYTGASATCEIVCHKPVPTACEGVDSCCQWFSERVQSLADARTGKEGQLVESDSNDPEKAKDLLCEQVLGELYEKCPACNGGEEQCALKDDSDNLDRLYSVMDGLPLAGQRSLASVAAIGLAAIGGAALLAAAAVAFVRYGAFSVHGGISASEAAGEGQGAPIMVSE
ncbi:unnamed protein product [Prorocentrum cordatum]|uniref:Uncharacterized protein n=1 Tax=Prorocentrum cordatum TaxID=2364126 RepID=A0ABN9X887_9DINO|nr:unnamed protein product [Polarella glacialis]